MRRKVLIGVLLPGVVVLVVVLFYGRRFWRYEPVRPPAPSAPQAPNWNLPPEDPIPVEEEKPAYQWPDDFELPMEFDIGDLPEVPERIIGPSPAIEDEEKPES